MPQPANQKKEDILIDHKNRKILFNSWIPQKTTSQLIIIHGFSEHMRCYAKTATQLCDAGIATHIMDLPGHGLSDGPRGHIDDFQDYIRNVALFFNSYPNFMKTKPTFLLGHSLGGLIACHYYLQKEPDIRGLILSSPLIGFPLLNQILTSTAAKLIARKNPNILVPKPSSVKSLSRNPSNWDRYRSDPLRLHTASPSLYLSMVRQARLLQHRAPDVNLPLLVFMTTEDRVVSPYAIQQFYHRSNSLDKSLVVFTKAMHELFQEEEQEQIITKMISWMKDRA